MPMTVSYCVGAVMDMSELYGLPSGGPRPPFDGREEGELVATRFRTTVLGMVVAATITGACGSNAATEEDEPSATSTASSTASAGDSTESAAASSSPGVQEGWERFESEEGGFAISLPSDWEAADLTSDDIDQIADFLAQDPATAPIADQLPTLIEQGVAFFAVSVDAAGMEAGFATNLNVVVQPDVTMSLDLYASANISFLESTFSVDVEREDIELPAGDAVRIEFETVIGASPSVHQTQYYFVQDGRGIIATFSRAAGDEFDGLEDVFADIMETMELLP
jgi:hypothetical protein